MARAGGVIPAHERSLLGPSQWAALEAGNQAHEGAIYGMAANNAAQQASDEEVYLNHARQARMREDAANSAALEREEELNRRAMDFDRMAKTLSQERIDPDRVWASKSTPRKVASLLAIGLGGFVQGARGGQNVGLEMVNAEIERDIRAQEFAYKAKRDSLEAQSTAFGMAMHRYQSVDAARAFARVAAMDAVTAEVQRQAVKGKGTEAANRALGALAELQEMRAQQILKGVQFVPATAAEPRYRLPNRLGTYTAKEVDAMIATEEGRGFELQKIDRGIEGDIAKTRAKDEGDDAKYISQALEKSGIPTARASAEIARTSLLAAPKGYAERVAELTVPGKSETVRKAAFGKGAAEREQNWMNFKNSAMKAMMGNVTGDNAKTGSEVQRATAALEGANDTESRLNAIKYVESVLAAQEENIRKGASPRGNRTYDERDVKTGGAKPITQVAPSFQGSK